MLFVTSPVRGRARVALAPPYCVRTGVASLPLARPSRFLPRVSPSLRAAFQLLELYGCARRLGSRKALKRRGPFEGFPAIPPSKKAPNFRSTPYMGLRPDAAYQAGGRRDSYRQLGRGGVALHCSGGWAVTRINRVTSVLSPDQGRFPPSLLRSAWRWELIHSFGVHGLPPRKWPPLPREAPLPPRSLASSRKARHSHGGPCFRGPRRNHRHAPAIHRSSAWNGESR